MMKSFTVGKKYKLVPSWGGAADSFEAEFRGYADGVSAFSASKGIFWTGKSQITMPLDSVMNPDKAFLFNKTENSVL